ncbi:MAG: thioredoxin family protein [Verrucomicrobia bacterium]|nr:thioredoxin family protein [Verrucomicrobiota bacterium]
MNVVCAVWAGTLLAVGSEDTVPGTKVRLLLSAERARPGDTVWAAVELTMARGWHTYWRNGGDAGGPTEIEWALPGGVRAGEIEWPLPEKHVTGPLTSYVYHDRVLLRVPLTLGTNVPPGPAELKANVTWLECEELCLQGTGTVSARLHVGIDRKPSPDAAAIEAARQAVPQPAADLPVRLRWEPPLDAETRPLLFEWDLPAPPATVDFLPYAFETFEVQADTERLPGEAGRVRFRKRIVLREGDWPREVAGVLVRQETRGGPRQAHEVRLTIGSTAAAARSGAGLGTLLLMLTFGFLGGLMLNVMPCVLPVIALKVLGFVNQSKEEPARVRQLGLVYGGGVVLSFLVLAALAVAVQQAGGLAGWGTAFQNPQFRVGITVLMTLVALNLFGVFEVTLSGSAMGAASVLTAKSGSAGAFFNGVLATVLATPCTAPFLGVALGFAFTQAPAVVVLMFASAGAGLALPFVLLCWHPAWLKWLPKPGRWMERFKVAMGFPMLATAVWLFWVTATRLGSAGVLWFGLFLVMLALAAWVLGEFVQRGTRRKGLAAAISLLIAATAYGWILEGQLHWRRPPAAAEDNIPWQPWSPEAVANARKAGRPVLVDFTADTCLNCQVNKVTSLDIAATRAKLKEINAVALIGDYTDQDPAIARELQRFGRPGVPLVLVYPKNPDKPPIVLPAILTPGIVMDALRQAAQ